MGFQGKVYGQVERVLNGQRSTGVVVKYTEEGAQYPDRVTAWLASDEVSDYGTPEVGDWVTYLGDVRARLSKPNAEGKVYVNVSLNNAVSVVEGVAARVAPPVDTYVPKDEEPF